MLRSFIHTGALLLLSSALAAPLDLEKRQATPNGQVEAEGGIDIPIGILGATTRVHVNEDGVPSVPLWGWGGPDHRDVRQGGMPDCWLDAALVSMTLLFPDYLISRFRTPDGSLYGSFVNVVLTLDGEEKEYSVPYLEAAQSKHLPKQNSDGSVYWWPAAAETAVQWFFNDRGEPDIFTKGGYPHMAIELLTGVPSGGWMSEDPEVVWENFKHYDQIPVIITTRDDDKGGTKTLISAHAYSIEGLDEIDGQRYVTVRNPWHDTQRHKLEDVFADMTSYAHFEDVTARPGVETWY